MGLKYLERPPFHCSGVGQWLGIMNRTGATALAAPAYKHLTRRMSVWVGVIVAGSFFTEAFMGSVTDTFWYSHNRHVRSSLPPSAVSSSWQASWWPLPCSGGTATSGACATPAPASGWLVGWLAGCSGPRC